MQENILECYINFRPVVSEELLLMDAQEHAWRRTALNYWPQKLPWVRSVLNNEKLFILDFGCLDTLWWTVSKSWLGPTTSKYLPAQITRVNSYFYNIKNC